MIRIYLPVVSERRLTEITNIGDVQVVPDIQEVFL